MASDSEIKFTNRPREYRFWDKVNKKMHYFDLTVSGGQIALICESEGNLVMIGMNSGRTYKGVLMDWTGLIDKNGKKIYEADIIRFKDKVYEVGYNKAEDPLDIEITGAYCLYPKDFNPFTDEVVYFERPSKNFEVVGNIYQNPELLQNPDILK